MIKSKFFFLTLFLILISSCIIFSDQLLKYSVEKIFSKWLKRDFIVSELSNNFKQNKLVLKNIYIKNNNGRNNNLFESKNIIIEYELIQLFRGILMVKKLTIVKPELVIEIIKVNDQIFKDNIDIAEKISLNKPDKIWPKKIVDLNFIIKNVEIQNLKIIISSNISDKKNKATFGGMQFFNIGNHKTSNHYKDTLKDIMKLTILNLQDAELKKQIERIYKLN